MGSKLPIKRGFTSKTVSNPYDQAFYRAQQATSAQSAATVVPAVVELLKPNSVVDVGCGVGTWLAAYQNLGITDLLGVDGDYVDRGMLKIPDAKFQPVNLSLPFDLPRTFDLAMSLEVGEHLPPEAADGFVKSLTRLAPIILYSAAIPYQQGANHVNEQWPCYWAALFRGHGYVTIDCLRDRFWNDSTVAWWYSQNMLLFIHESLSQKFAPDNVLITDPSGIRSLVHPKLFEQWQLAMNPRHMSLRTATRIFTAVARKAVGRRVPGNAAAR